MKDEVEAVIKNLIKQAEKANDSNDAMRFAQAAVNVAHAYATMEGANQL